MPVVTPAQPAPHIYTPTTFTPTHYAPGRTAMTALIPNGPVEAGDPSYYLTRGYDGVAARAKFATETGARPMIPSLMGSRGRVEEGLNPNIVTNPLFGVNADGWTAGGNFDTPVRSTEQARYGPASGKCVVATTNGGANGAATFVITVPSAGTWAYSIDVYIPSAWSGTGAITAAVSNFAGGSGVSTAAADTGKRDQWQRTTVIFVVDAGDLTGILRVNATDIVAGEFFYVDAAQGEKNAYATSFCPLLDAAGDPQTGYAWSGAAHASTSVRTASLLQAASALLVGTSWGLAMWVRPTSDATGGRRIIGALDAADDWWEVYFEDTNLVFQCQNAGAGINTRAGAHGGWSLSDDLLIVLNRSGDDVELFMNADSKASGSLSNGFPTISDTVVTLGATERTPRPLNGLLGPAYFANRPFTQAEINADFRSRWTPMGALAA